MPQTFPLVSLSTTKNYTKLSPGPDGTAGPVTTVAASELTELMSKVKDYDAEKESGTLAAPISRPREGIKDFATNAFDMIIELNEGRLKNWKKKAAKPESKGNALTVGEKIFIPRPRPAAEPGKTSVKFSNELAKLDSESLKKIWREEFLEPFYLKLCPPTLVRRVLECILPTDCRELIKFLGLWRTRDLIENFAFLDVFDGDPNSLINALKKWDELVEEKYSFKAVSISGDTGILSSGQFNSATTLFATGSSGQSSSSSLSVSLQVRIKPSQQKLTKWLFSVGDASSSGTYNGGGFAIKKNSQDSLDIDVYSTTGKKASYQTDTSVKLSDDLWHQIGFSWAGSAGQLTAYIDGRKVGARKTSDKIFVGAIATSENARVVVGSQKHNSVYSTPEAQFDEISIFEKVLTPTEWKSAAKIKSDINLKTEGLERDAIAWWRMGDAVGDNLHTQEDSHRAEAVSGPTTIRTEDAMGKIIDMKGDIDLAPYGDSLQGSRAPEIVVVRLFEEKDQDRFIDILNRETDVVKMCDWLLELLLGKIDVSFDPEKKLEELLGMFRMPKFSKDPHRQIEIVLKKTVVESLVRMLSQLLMVIFEKIVECEQWKTMLKGLVRGALAGSDEAALEALSKPLEDFVGAVQDPAQWEKLLKKEAPFLTREFETAWGNMLEVREEGQKENEYTTLGLGSVQFKEEHKQVTKDSYEVPTILEGEIGSSTVSIENTSTATEQDVIIALVRKVSQELPPEELLSLFTTSASESTILTVTGMINELAADLDMEFSTNDIITAMGMIGSQLNLEGAIDQLQYAAQLFNEAAPPPNEFCVSSQDLADRMGLGKSEAEKQSNKDLLEQIFDMIDESEEGTDKKCGTPIPLGAAEETSLERTINSAYATITTSYDNDLSLYKLGSTSWDEETREIKKVLWKGDDFQGQVADSEGNIKWDTIEIEETQMNPEFKSMVENGFVPLKKNGKVDGTKYGGVVKINWNPFNSDPWLKEKRPPESLVPAPPENEDDDVQQPDVEIGDLWTSLGPYTDYTEESATIGQPRLVVGGSHAAAFSGELRDLLLKDGSGTSYFSSRDSGRENGPQTASKRGIKNIESKSQLSLAPPDENSNIDSSFSTITRTVDWGRSLEGSTYISFEKTGADKYSFETQSPFNIPSDLMESINATGYDQGPLECDIGTPTSPEFTDEAFTPQEYVFEQVLKNTSPNLLLPPDEIKTELYNSLYRELMTAVMYRVGDSPLLKPVPNTGRDGEPDMLAINFLNIATTPRLIDMKSFSSQVAEDYTVIRSCPDDLVEPPLYSALKTSVPRILARLCIVDIAVRGIVPFSQLSFSKKDPVIKRLILEKLEQDIGLFARNRVHEIKAKVIQQYNQLAETGNIDAPPIETEENALWPTVGWETAMDYFLEEEFDSVMNRLQEMVHGDCIPSQNEKGDQVKDDLYEAIFSYAELGDKNLKLETYAIFTDPEDEAGRRETEFNLETQWQDIQAVGTALTYSYKNRLVVLSSVEQGIDELLEALGLDFENIECDNSAIYPDVGATTMTDGHYHEYNLVRGGGNTSLPRGVADGANVPPHTHAIYQYAVVPEIKDNIVDHGHSLIPRDNPEAQSVEDMLKDHMRGLLAKTNDFKVLFNFSFNLNDISSLILTYCLLSAENPILLRTFNSTKKRVVEMFDWLWREDVSTDDCETKEAEPFGLDLADFFPDFADAIMNPELLLMMLLAPLTTYKGWARTADPHVFITLAVMDALKLPLLPKNSKRNIPTNVNPLSSDFGELECINFPQWPGHSILDTITVGANDLYPFRAGGPAGSMQPGAAGIATSLMIEPAVALGVTYAPLMFGLPPYPPTPYGLIYYMAVSPIIWLMKDLPRLLNAIQGSDNAKMIIGSTGLHMGELTCDSPVPTENGEQGSSSSTPDETTSEEECPPVPDFNDTAMDIGTSKDC